MCKGTIQDGFSTFTIDMGGCVIVVKNVPSGICEQCGETSYNDEVARQLEHIIQNITKSVSAEIAVVNYSRKTAYKNSRPLRTAVNDYACFVPPEFTQTTVAFFHYLRYYKRTMAKTNVEKSNSIKLRKSEPDLISDNYSVWLESLKKKIQSARARAALTVNAELIHLYHRIGTMSRC